VLPDGRYQIVLDLNEFRAFPGLSPERFLRAERPFRNHVRLD
jgi:hypothetical protein